MFFLKEKINFENKKVFLRTSFNVPIDKKKQKIESDFRIKRSLKTIDFLLKKKAKVIIISHIGRDKGQDFNLVFKYLKKNLFKKHFF